MKKWYAHTDGATLFAQEEQPADAESDELVEDELLTLLNKSEDLGSLDDRLTTRQRDSLHNLLDKFPEITSGLVHTTVAEHKIVVDDCPNQTTAIQDPNGFETNLRKRLMRCWKWEKSNHPPAPGHHLSFS